MSGLIFVLVLICCVLLIAVIMVQNPKGGGLTSGFSSANQIGGVRKTTDFLEKATWTLAIALMVISLGSAALLPNKGGQTVTQSTDAQQALQNLQNVPQGVNPNQFGTQGQGGPTGGGGQTPPPGGG